MPEPKPIPITVNDGSQTRIVGQGADHKPAPPAKPEKGGK